MITQMITLKHSTNMHNVDEQCVNDLLEIGKPLGGFIPSYNRC